MRKRCCILPNHGCHISGLFNPQSCILLTREFKFRFRHNFRALEFQNIAVIIFIIYLLLTTSIQGEVPLKKVLFDAKLEHDFIKNYKVLQSVFDKKQITKV
jgi:hypothetical protein